MNTNNADKSSSWKNWIIKKLLSNDSTKEDILNFIANDESDYYKKALEFYENHNKIEKIGSDLRDQALSSPLLDAKNFSKNFYNKLHEIYTSH